MAVPEVGVLAEPTMRLLRDAGYSELSGGRLRLYDDPNQVDFFLLAERDIPTFVSEGQLHLGVCRHIHAEESSAAVSHILRLELKQEILRLFCPDVNGWTVQDLAGRRIATQFPRIVRSFLAQQRIAAKDVIRLDRVGNAIELQVADAITDFADPSTLASKAFDGLVIVGDPILDSDAVLIGRNAKYDQEPDTPEIERSKERFADRLRAVVTARRLHLLHYDCPHDLVARTIESVESSRAPVVAPLADPGWSTVRVLVDSSKVSAIVERLLDLGCREIMTSALQSYHDRD